MAMQSRPSPQVPSNDPGGWLKNLGLPDWLSKEFEKSLSNILERIFKEIWSWFSKPSVGPNANAAVVFDPIAKLFKLGDARGDNGGRVEPAIKLAEAVVAILNDLSQTLGITIQPPEYFIIGYERKGYSHNFPFYDGHKRFANFATPQDAVESTVIRALKTSTLIGLSAEEIAAIKTSRATTLDGLLRELARAATNDTVIGGEGADNRSLGLGDDSAIGNGGHDTFYGAAGNDTLRGGEGNDLLDGGTGNDQLFGDAGDDTLSGGAGDDSLDGGAGNDLLVGGPGADTLHGGAGFDTADYSAAASGITLAMGNPAAGRGDAAGDVLIAIERVIGTRFSDVIAGDSSNNIIELGAGNDRGMGGEGNDTLLGGEGDDTLSGGAGNDLIVGGAGRDVAEWRGPLSSYSVANGTVIVRSGLDTDTVQGVEVLKFSNGNLVFDAGAQQTMIARLYETILNRTYDPGGLSSASAWMDKGASLVTIAQSLISSPEFSMKFGVMRNDAFIFHLYRSGLERDPEPGGFKWATKALETGASRAQLAVWISESPESYQKNAHLAQNGIWHAFEPGASQSYDLWM